MCWLWSKWELRERIERKEHACQKKWSATSPRVLTSESHYWRRTIVEVVSKLGHKLCILTVDSNWMMLGAQLYSFVLCIRDMVTILFELTHNLFSFWTTFWTQTKLGRNFWVTSKSNELLSIIITLLYTCCITFWVSRCHCVHYHGAWNIVYTHYRFTTGTELLTDCLKKQFKQ